ALAAPGWAAVFPFVEPDFVGGAVHALEVPDAAVRDDALEAIGVHRKPHHHVAAERRPRGADALPVHVRQLLDVIEPLHQIAIALAAPVAGDLIDELLPKPGRAARIRQHDDVALRRPHLRVPAIRPSVLPRALRAAVDEEGDGPFL